MSKRRIYIGIIISYLAIFLLPLLINIFSLNDIARDTQKNICESVRINLQHVQESVDNDFREINRIVENLTGNVNILYLATQMTEESKNVEYSRIKQAQEYIAALQVQRLAEEYYVYFHKPEMIVSPHKVFLNAESSYFFFQYGRYGQEEWLEKMKEEYTQFFFPSEPTMQNVFREETFLYVQSLVTSTGKKGTFIFPIRTQAVREQMEDYYIPKEGWAYVLDREGKKILSMESTNGEFLEIDSRYLDGKTGIRQIRVDGRDMELVFVSSDYTGLTYVAVIPEEYISEEVVRAQGKLVFLMAAVLLAGLLCIGLVSWRKGKKITQIVQMIFTTGTSEENLDGTDAMEYISREVQNLIAKNTGLCENILKQEPVTRELLLEKLLIGGGDTSMYQNLEHFGIVLEGEMLVMLCSLKNPGLLKMEIGESSVYKQLLISDLEEAFEEKKYICSLDMDSFAVILMLRQDYGCMKSDILRKMQDMQMRYQEEYRVDLRICVSEACREWQEIGNAYDQVCELMEYGSDHRKKILFYDEYSDKKEYYYFPVTLEERLINAVKTGNTSATHEQLHQIFTMNVLERDLNPVMMHMLINDLQCTIYKIMHGLNLELKTDEGELSQGMQQLAEEKELLNRFQHLNHIFGYLCEKVAEENQEEKNEMVKAIASYVDQHYQDQSMSLTKIAEEFGYASTYFSRLFKEQFGMNFTTYLETIRMKQVCRLLTTDLTLDQIAGQTGYNSVYVMRTAFKRIKGMTPNDYRKVQQEEM